MSLQTPLRLLIAFAAYQCAALPNTPLVSQVVPEVIAQMLKSSSLLISFCMLHHPILSPRGSPPCPSRGVHHRAHRSLHLRILTSYLWSQIATSTVNEIRHLPANQIISFLQADDSQCRGVSTALKSEVNTLIASDQAVCVVPLSGSPGRRPLTLYDRQAFNALDTGANCPST